MGFRSVAREVRTRRWPLAPVLAGHRVIGFELEKQPTASSGGPCRRCARQVGGSRLLPAMRLELRWSEVADLAAGEATRLVGRRLEVGLDGLSAELAADPRLAAIRLDLAHPGERCRIGRVFDVIAPRARMDGPDFPGVLGPVARAGAGRCLALDGVAVVVTDQQMASVATLAVIDMAGPNAALSAFGSTHNLVI